jgi:lysophospholipase L1-like esterase
VKFFSDLLKIREPEKSVTVINRGIGGNTAEDLRSRWTDDALSHRPDWMSIKIGINDANRHINGSGDPNISPKEYRVRYEEILEQTREALPERQLLLITPFFLSKDTAPNSYRAKVARLLPEYIGIVTELSAQYGTRLLNLHERFHRNLEHAHPDVYCPEPVHPNQTGHLLIAEAVYESLSE